MEQHKSSTNKLDKTASQVAHDLGVDSWKRALPWRDNFVEFASSPKWRILALLFGERVRRLEKPSGHVRLYGQRKRPAY